jgi:predicted aspartyl protease
MDGRSTQAAQSQALTRAGDADVVTALGEALFRAGLIPEAARTLEPLVPVDSPPARALLFLGLTRAAEGRDADAAELLSKAASSDPEDRDVLFRAAGAAATRAGAVRMLEAYLARSVGDDPDRIEGAKGTVRLYRALGERPVWVPAPRPAQAEIPLWPLRDRSGALRGFVIEMTVPQGKPIRLLLDTGSSGLFLVQRIAARAGFSVLSEETVFGGGGDARQASRRGLFSSVAFGPISFTDALASVTDEEIEPTGQYHGVVGLSVFAGYTVVLDLPRARLVLEKETGQAQGSPYWEVEGQMLVEAETAGGARGLFLLDTGATSSVLSEGFAAHDPASRLGDPAPVRAFGGPLKGSRSLRGVTVRFQGLETRSGSTLRAADLTQRSRLGGVEVAGFLGLDILDRTTITVASRARRVSVLAGRK